ncbi:MAG: DUF485 domain-containing protein [Nocardioides sp.]
MSDSTSRASGQPDSHTHADPNNPVYRELAGTAEFQELRRRFRGFVFPTTVVFMAWYLLYVLLSTYAKGFMSTKVLGNINLGLILGLLQFASTFLIAWLYSRRAAASFDPLAQQLKARYEGGEQA